MKPGISGARDLPLGQSLPGRVSVIVPTRNSQRTLAQCLTSIRAQTYPDVEAIVVDNSSTDDTLRLARELADLVLTAGPERSAQRNVGAAASIGEFLVFLDSDMVAAPDVAEDVATIFARDHEIQALVLPEHSVGEGFWARCKEFEKELYVGDLDIEAARAFRRSIFIHVGGYDEEIHGGGEDWDLPERVVRAGGLIERSRSRILHDEGSLALAEHLAQKFYYGRSLGRYVRKHPRNALRKIIRLGFLGKTLTLFRTHPQYVLGVFFLKFLEYGALGAGMAVSGIRGHPVRRIRNHG